MADIDEFFSGTKLYGDDFDSDQLRQWYEDEKEAYADLGAKSRGIYRYAYHELNRRYGFRFLTGRVFASVLGLGSAYGDEFLPIIDRIRRITILDPSEALAVDNVGGIPVTYAKPTADGILPFPDSTFDLITSFGVLHHIPNVSTVLREMRRCLTPEGVALIREPTTSMGDWRRPRKGLTRRERGIPLHLFRKMLMAERFRIVNEQRCLFSLTYKLRMFHAGPVMNSPTILRIDKWCCRLFSFNMTYHATTLFHRFRPTSVFYVLAKA